GSAGRGDRREAVRCGPEEGGAARSRVSQARLGRLDVGGDWLHELMHEVVQAAILGVLTGGVYALMASGLTLVFGIMRVINVAQGALVILAAYLSYALFSH